MFKNIRIFILLLVLLVVALGVYKDKNHDWKKPVFVVVYPINVDNSPEVARYINTLSNQDFKGIESYLNSESRKYAQDVNFYYRLGEEVEVMPPPVPRNGGVLNAIVWSLKFRYYAYKYSNDVGVPGNLKLFLQFHDPNKRIITETSTALQNGRIGVVNLFGKSEKNQNNNVVIAHETLHAFGASDKYDLQTGIPIYPDGYANPNQSPLLPQTHAELMAVHIPKTPTNFEMARNLKQTVIGEMTAQEVGWVSSK